MQAVMPEVEERWYRQLRFIRAKKIILKSLCAILLTLLSIGSIWIGFLPLISGPGFIIALFYSLLTILGVLMLALIYAIYYLQTYCMWVNIFLIGHTTQGAHAIYLHPDTLQRKKWKEDQLIIIYPENKRVLATIRTSPLMKKNKIGIPPATAILLGLREDDFIKINPIIEENKIVNLYFGFSD